MRFLLTPGQAGDKSQLLPLLDGIHVGRDRPGRPRCRPEVVILVCPERDDQIAHRAAKGSRGGRPPAFDTDPYKQRTVVERCFNKLTQFRDLATRHAKRTAYYQASLTIAAIILWLR
jgi:transposase